MQPGRDRRPFSGDKIMRRTGLIVLTGLLIGAAPDTCPEPADATKTDHKKLQGTWTVQKLERGGKPDPNSADKMGIKMVIKDDKLTIKEKDRDEVATFKLDGKKNPKEITIIPKGDKEVPGIYKVDKDTLTICFAKAGDGPRPKSFDTKGTKHSLIILKRDKP
jgi:uncharacterized protein (TIGR03067 family)